MSRTRTALGGFILLLLTQAWAWGLGFLTAIIVPRYLKDTGLGQVSFAKSILSVAWVLVGFGGATQIVRAIAADHDKADSFLSSVLTQRTLFGVPIIAAVCVTTGLMVHDARVSILLAIYGVQTYVVWILDALLASRRALGEFGTFANSEMTGTALGVFTKVGLVVRGLGTIGAALGDFMTAAAGVVVALLGSKRRFHLRLTAMDDVIRVLVDGRPFFFYSLTQFLIGTSLATYVLVRVGGYTAAGWYAAAFQVTALLFALPSAIVNVLTPLLTQTYTANVDEFVSVARRTARPMLVGAIPFALILILRADRITSFLGWPVELHHADLVLRIAGCGILVRWAGMFFGMLLIASNRVWLQARAAMTALPISVVLTVVLANVFHRTVHNAAAGAILAGELTELVITLVYIRSVHEPTIVRTTLSGIGRGLVAGIVPAAILLLPMPNRPLTMLWCVLAPIAFAGAAVAVGAVRWADIQLIIQRARAKGEPQAADVP